MSCFKELTSDSQITLLDISFDAPVAENRPCPCCSSLAQATLIPFEQPYINQGKPFIARANVPGYECNECNIATYDKSACLQAYQAVKSVVHAVNDIATLRMVEASIKVLS